MVRAKVYLNASTEFGGKARQLKFLCVHDNSTEENARFTKYTPTGEITMLVDNPGALAQFRFEKYYYVDFTEVEDESTKPSPA